VKGELPKGWVWTNLSKILSKYESGSRPKGGVQKIEQGIPSIGGEHLTSRGNFDFSKIKYVPHDFFKRMNTGVINKGDILIVKDGATTGKVSIIRNDFPFDKAAINEHVFLCRVFDEISNYYLFYYLFSSIGQNYVKLNFKGTAQGGINLSFFKNAYIPLPPLAEQQRIVNKIEELFTNLDKGIEYLEAVKSKLIVYRQAILKYAMEGKLTEDWRERNKDKVEFELFELKKIIEEKQNILNAIRSNEVNDGNFPHSWIRLRLIDLTNFINPGFPCGRHNNERKGIIHIRPMNIDKVGKINLINTKYVEIEKFDPLMKGDILFNNTNSPELVGKTAHIDFDSNWAYSNHMTRIRIKSPLVNNKWISTYLHFLFTCGYFGKICVHHVNQSSVGSKYLSEKILIPMPSLSEQNLIIRYVERYFSLIDKQYEMIMYELEESNALRQSILKKAFEGKLVPQDPNDEPAEILLEKIKMEKSNKVKLVQEKLI